MFHISISSIAFLLLAVSFVQFFRSESLLFTFLRLLYFHRGGRAYLYISLTPVNFFGSCLLHSAPKKDYNTVSRRFAASLKKCIVWARGFLLAISKVLLSRDLSPSEAFYKMEYAEIVVKCMYDPRNILNLSLNRRQLGSQPILSEIMELIEEQYDTPSKKFNQEPFTRITGQWLRK